MRRWMIRVALLSCSCGTLGLGGCANFTRAEMDLTAQARKGVALIRAHDVARAGLLAELARMRRSRLDEAFDADVREHATTQPIDVDWVIEARKAYAIALDAYAKAQASNDQAWLKRKELLSDVDALLERLQWMQSTQLKFDLMGEGLGKSLETAAK